MKKENTYRITLAILAGLVLGIAVGLLMPGHFDWFLYAVFFYGGLVKLLGKCSPRRFFAAVMPAALNAFGTCSSSATIPLSMACMEEDLECPNEYCTPE